MHSKARKELIKFISTGAVASGVLTLVIVFLTYKDILYVRFFSGFIGSFSLESGKFQEFLFAGFADKLSISFSKYGLPILLVLVGIILIYSSFANFQKVYNLLDINLRFINTKKQPTPKLLLNIILVRSGAFVLPLIFWTVYIFWFFPQVAKIPLKYIATGNLILLSLVSLFVLIALFILTHGGLVFSRLCLRFLKTT